MPRSAHSVKRIGRSKAVGVEVVTDCSTEAIEVRRAMRTMVSDPVATRASSTSQTDDSTLLVTAGPVLFGSVHHGPMIEHLFDTGQAGYARRGAFWHEGQKNELRFMNATRRIGVPQRSHGSPARPYALSDRAK